MSKSKHQQSTEQALSGDQKQDRKNSEKESPKKTIGTVLRDERKKKGLSYAQVSALTKLRSAILEDLENESWNNLPSPVFASGFVRSYGRVLGLEEKKVMNLYQESNPVKISAPKPLSRPPKSKKVPFFSMVFILFAISSSYFLWKGYTIKKNVSNTPTVVVENKPASEESGTIRKGQITTKEQPSKQDEADSIPELINETNEVKRADYLPELINESIEIKSLDKVSNQDINSKEDTSITSNESVAPQLTLEASIREKTWVKIFVDDNEPKEYIFRQGRRYKWKAKKGFELLIGNAGGIDLEIDGEKVETPGTVGQVVRLRIPNSYKRVR